MVVPLQCSFALGRDAGVLAPSARYGCHLSGTQLAALQLWACGYSSEQIGHLLCRGSVAAAVKTLGSAALALGASDVGAAVTAALDRQLIV